ncbi:MAG: tetratricopeptide repeat protein, partial [Cyanobacteria bacterium J06641_5]
MPHLDRKQPFSQSPIWQLQRNYFSEVGIDAWRTGEVPHYLTSNPVVGKTYAELVLAFLRDLSLKGRQTETVYLIELGAGHGRLCYHFFKHFEKYYDRSAIPLPPFCYILSDFTAANLGFWQEHPRLQPYLGKSWLEFAQFDVETSN